MHKKHPHRQRKIKKIVRLHAVFLTISFGLYIVLSALFGPEFILSDMRHKFSALADDTVTITAKVLAPPVTPIVSAEAVCTNGNLAINLNWPDDENTQTYSIDRDSLPLVSGLVNSQYEDTNIIIDTSYTYSVTAFGPMGPGSAVSQEVTAATPTECEIPAPPADIKIVAFETKDISDYESTPQTTNRYPSFSGTTNIPNAKINITLESGPIVYGTTTANANGFWEWTCPEIMDFGSHTLYVVATDPDDASITDSDVFSFEIVKENNGNNNDNDNNHNHKKNTTATISPTNQPIIITPAVQAVAPFEIVSTIENSGQTVFAGNELLLRLDFSKKSPALANKNYEFFYTILDAKNNAVIEASENINVLQTDFKLKRISIPALTHAGNYKIQVKTYDGRNLIASDSLFKIKELPVINIGSVTVSLTDIMRGLSWIIIGLLLTVTFFLALLGIEHHLSEQALFQITEDYLRRKDFFTKRKGVNK